MKHSVSVAALLLGLALVGCGAGSGEGPDGPGGADLSSYDRTLVPVKRPAGLTAVRAQDYADPGVSGQTLQLSFGADTLYSCLRPSGEEVSAVEVAADRRSAVIACPQEGRRVLKVVTRGDRETVFSVDADPVAGKGSTNPTAKSDVVAFVEAGEFELAPAWLVSELGGPVSHPPER